MTDIQSLPLEVLQKTLGMLDRGMLLSARVVSKLFRLCASPHLTRLDINWRHLRRAHSTALAQLSGLTQLEVSVEEVVLLEELVRNRLAPRITHLKLQVCPDGAEALAPLARLPNLRSLAIPYEVDVVPSLPTTLQELVLLTLADGTACRSLTRLSSLTHISVRLTASAGPSLASFSRLASLCSLALSCFFRPLGILQTFTGLTSLTLESMDPTESGSFFADIAHLNGLSALDLSLNGYVERDELACLSGLTSLTRLDMSACKLDDSTYKSTALAPLTRLADLALSCGMVGVSLLPSIRVEALQDLWLNHVTGDIAVLGRATGLTAFGFVMRENDQYDVVLSSTLPDMSGVSDLDLTLTRKPVAPGQFQLGPVLHALTGLTSLRYSGNLTVDIDLRAIAALPRLRILGLQDVSELTPAHLPALQAMSDLTELDITNTGVTEQDLTTEVRERFDVERLRRGWPRLVLLPKPKGDDTSGEDSNSELSGQTISL